MPRPEVNALNSSVMALKQNVEQLVGQRGNTTTQAMLCDNSFLGDNLSFSGTTLEFTGELIDSVVATGPISGSINNGTLFLSAAAAGTVGSSTTTPVTYSTGVKVENISGVVSPNVNDFLFTGAPVVTQRGSAGVSVYVPPLDVSGYSENGSTIDAPVVNAINFEGNAFLQAWPLIEELGVVNSGPTPLLTISGAEYGGGFLYIEFNAPTSSIPYWIDGNGPVLENIADCELYWATINNSVANPITLSSYGESDCVARVVTSPAVLLNSFSGPLTPGLAASTISLPVNEGRLYVAIVDQHVTVPVTVQSAQEFNTSIVSTMSSPTEPTPTGVLLGADISVAGTITLTISSSMSFSNPAYLGAMLIAPPGPNPNDITVTVPPLEVISAGATVSDNLWTLSMGLGMEATGGPNSATLSNTGVLGLVQGSVTAAGAINITGTGATLTTGTAGSTLAICGGGITYGGVSYSTLAAGSNITIIPSGGVGGTLTVSASGGGGIYAPLVNGDLPGPGLVTDAFGQCIMVRIS